MGLYLDDLFTSPDTRSRGVGRALLNRAAELAGDGGASVVRWITADESLMRGDDMSATSLPAGRGSKLRTGLRWLAIGATAASVALAVVFLHGVTSGFAYVLGIAVAWVIGFLAIRVPLNRLAAPPSSDSAVKNG